MYKFYFFSAVVLMLAAATDAGAQDFKKDQQKQERTIKVAQQKRLITAREYEKLMNEQSVIKAAITRAEEDGVWTPREKNAVAGKLGRAGRRLHRYKTNGEIY